MPESFLTAFHFAPSVDKKEAARRLGGALETFRAHGLEPYPYAKRAWESATPRIFGATTLLHKSFSTLTDDPLWGAGFMIVPASEAEATIVTMTTPAAPQPDSWRWLMQLAENLCGVVEPELSLINGFTIDSSGRASRGTPAGEEVSPGHPPGVLAPWMYWSDERLRSDDLTERMSAITSAHRNGRAGKRGWVLQPCEDYSATPPERILQECQKAWDVQNVNWIGVA